MGNTASNDNASKPLAIVALARQMKLQKAQVTKLRDTLVALSVPDERVTRANFHAALKTVKLKAQDLEIFDLLFTMWDADGTGRVPCKEFSMGISPLACPDEQPGDIIRFALGVSDEEQTGLVGPDELEDMLLSIDSTASYFGDPNLKYKCIRRVVDCVFEDKSKELQHQECIPKLLENAYIKRFISGKTRSRVKFQDEVVEAIKRKEAARNNRPPPKTVNIVESLMDSWSLSISSSSLSLSSHRNTTQSPSPRNASWSNPRNAPRSSPRNAMLGLRIKDTPAARRMQLDPPTPRRPQARIEC